MSQNSRFRNNSRKQQQPKPKVDKEDLSPLLKAFQLYAGELDDKHDRHERIVKLSRDITIESKRVIFLLHTIDGRKNNRAKVLHEAEQRLQKVIEINFKAIARELQEQDTYQYRAAYSAGLQEFIEAYSFMEYFKSGADESLKSDDENQSSLSDWAALQSLMQYEEVVSDQQKVTPDTDPETTITADQKSESDVPNAVNKFHFFVDPHEYILGISDLTGELMRRCINSLGSGETNVCLETCKVLQKLYIGYLGPQVQRWRELSRKIYTMRQSVLKAENVCYNVKVRGGEAAKWGAVFDSKPHNDEDEGFY